MNPALIGVVLVILLVASRAADDAEEEHREAAGDGDPESWSWRRRVGVMAGGILLMPLGVALAGFPEILFMDGPAWWWLWLAGAVAYGAFLVMAALGEAHGDAGQPGDAEALLHGDLGAILRRQMPGAADTDPPER
jgi:hypothetical protein